MQLQASSRDCFVCGVQNPAGLHIRFYTPSPGEVQAEFTPPLHFQGYPGVLHGGIIATLLDETAGRAYLNDPHQPRFMYTARLTVQYRRPVPVGQLLRLHGRALQSKGRTATAHATLHDAAGNLLAEAEALLVDLPPETLNNVNLAELGWRVYPENQD